MITVYFLDHFARPYDSKVYPDLSVTDWSKHIDGTGYWSNVLHPDAIPPAVTECLAVILKEQLYTVFRLSLPNTQKKADRRARKLWPGYDKNLMAYMVHNVIGYRIVTGDGVPDLYEKLTNPEPLTGEFERNPYNK